MAAPRWSLVVRAVCAVALLAGTAGVCEAWSPFGWHHGGARRAFYGPGVVNAGPMTYGAVPYSAMSPTFGACPPCPPCPCPVVAGPCGPVGCPPSNPCSLDYPPGAPLPDDFVPAGPPRTYADPADAPPPVGVPPYPEPDHRARDEGGFRETQRSEPESEGNGDHPFSPPRRPSVPEDDGDQTGPDTGPIAPLKFDDAVLLRVAPVRHRVHAEAQYAAPQLVRVPAEPQSPWRPVAEERRLAGWSGTR